MTGHVSNGHDRRTAPGVDDCCASGRYDIRRVLSPASMADGADLPAKVRQSVAHDVAICGLALSWRKTFRRSGRLVRRASLRFCSCAQQSSAVIVVFVGSSS